MQQKKTPFFTRFKETLIKNVWKKEDLQTEEENIWRKEKENIWKEKELGGALMDELSTCVSLGPSFRYIWNGSGIGGNTCGWEERENWILDWSIYSMKMVKFK